MPVQVSLNVAARDLLDNGLAETIDRGLARHGLPPDALLLEINERVLTSEPALRRGHGRGAGRARRVAEPRRLRDRLLLAGPAQAAAGQRGEDRLVVRRAAAALRRRRGDRPVDRGPGPARSASDSVAEGVESAEVAAALAAMGCDAAQGWYFSKPLNAVSATAWLAEHGVAPRHPRPPRRSRKPAPAVLSRSDGPAAGRRHGGRRLRSARRGVARLACMPITSDEVAHLARLSRLALSRAELDHFAGQLDVIIAVRGPGPGGRRRGHPADDARACPSSTSCATTSSAVPAARRRRCSPGPGRRAGPVPGPADPGGGLR